MKPIKTWTEGVQVEDEAMRQLEDAARLPFIHHHVAAMPDVHWGIGATVGSVLPMKGAVVPAAVGVDIGCGMVAQCTSLRAEHLPDNLHDLRHDIERTIPVGFNAHKECPATNSEIAPLFEAGRFNVIPGGLVNAKQDPEVQLGTLGGGNHFIELCLDENDYVWVMLHSGSRGIGNRVGRHFIERAKRECEMWGVELPNRDLAWLPEGSDGFTEYVDAVGWCQDYARINRDVMLRLVLRSMRHRLGEFVTSEKAINCYHNYVEREHHYGANVWLTRKGAVRAREGDMGIIPGSMGAKSFIVRGKGNPESFHSCSHGAGRAMSRKAAKERFTVADHEVATAGVECRKDAGVLDETPGAYKDIDAVMAAQADLVEVVHTLKQVVCVKG